MAGVWRKTMKYLGLVEDEEFDVDEAGAESVDDLHEEAVASPRPRPARPQPRARRIGRAEPRPPHPEATEGIVRTIPQSRPPSGTIHRAEPRRFNEAREIGERFKEGVPVIMNLQQTEDPTARRLVDFASGLVFAQDGKIELVAQRVYLLTPADVEVSAEERERIKEGGFFNQF